jgi:hypothetical protein
MCTPTLAKRRYSHQNDNSQIQFKDIYENRSKRQTAAHRIGSSCTIRDERCNKNHTSLEQLVVILSLVTACKSSKLV